MLSAKQYKRDKQEFYYNFGEQMRRLRAEHHLSVEDLSARCGIAPYLLRDMEIGRSKDWGNIFKLAQFYEKKIRFEFY